MPNYSTKDEAEKSINRGPLVRRVDHQATFDSSGSPRGWASIMGLVLWIAIWVKFIVDLFAYVDDNFGFDIAGKDSDICYAWVT